MYDEHFGLSARPFQLTPDPAFWYETATHRRAMAYLGYGLAQGEGFIVITGDIGAGKTTLMGHLFDTLDREALNPIKIVSTAIDAADLLRIVAQGLGVDPAGLPKAQLLVAIERGLHAVARTGRRTLLVVDEAQALPTGALEELRMLSNFQAGGHALLQIVLLGQPEFRAALHGSTGLEQLRQRVIAIHHLEPMATEEVAPYVRHRLTVAGWTGRPGFADGAFAALHRYSDGVPRRLNQLANRVMLHAAIEGVDLVTAATVELVAADLFADLPTIAPAPVDAGLVDALPTDEPAAANENAVDMPRTAEPKAVLAGDPVAIGQTPIAAAPADDIAVKPVAVPVPTLGEDAAPDPGPARDDQPTAAPAEDVVVAAPVKPDEHRPVAPAPVMVGRSARPFRHSWLAPAAEQSVPAGGQALVEPAPMDAATLDRLALLEVKVEEQDAALRRVLTLMVDWMDGDHAASGAAPRAVSAAAPEPLGYVPIRGAVA